MGERTPKYEGNVGSHGSDQLVVKVDGSMGRTNSSPLPILSI